LPAYSMIEGWKAAYYRLSSLLDKK